MTQDTNNPTGTDALLEEIRSDKPSPVMNKNIAVHTRMRAASVRKTCEHTPHHPLAKQYLETISGMKDEEELFVYQSDMEAILTGCELKEVKTEEYPFLVIDRVVGKALPAPAKSASKPSGGSQPPRPT